MPMSGAALAAALKPVIETEIRTNFTITAGFGDAELTKFAQAIADAVGETVVTYIQANAAVSGTVTSGAGSGGSVVGTVT